MAVDMSYLFSLGYTEEDLREYEASWADGIIAFLSANQANVIENMRFLRQDFESDLLLRLPVFYPDAFALEPQDFSKHVSALKAAFPYDWSDIIEGQFSGFDGMDGTYMTEDVVKNRILYQPFLETVGTNRESDVMEALRSLQAPSSRIYKFIVMLTKETGLDLAAEDFPEETLLDLEQAKYEVVDNVCALQKKGMTESVIRTILWCNPMMLWCSTSYLDNVLRSSFGDNYVETMEEKMNSGQLEDALYSI